MYHYKRYLCVGLCICMILGLLCSCSKEPDTASQDDGIFSVYATFYPIYAIAEMLMEDVPDTRLHCLVQPQDGCLRAYSLSDWDLSLLASNADMVISGGRGLESFESLLYNLGDDGPVVASILYDMELKNFEAVNASPDSDSHWIGENPHVYMKIDGALQIADRIAGSLMMLDPDHAEFYQKNLDNAKNRLESVRDEMHNAAGAIEKLKVAIMNEALAYLADEYNLNPVLCYDRENGENLYEAELDECLRSIEASGAKVVLIEKQAPETLKNALSSAGYAIAELNVMSTANVDKKDGYFDIQKENAKALRAAFDKVENIE